MSPKRIVLACLVVAVYLFVADWRGLPPFSSYRGGTYDVPLGGTVPDLYSVPLVGAAPRPLEGATWLSTPVRDPAGAVFGLVELGGAKLGVKLEEVSGRVLWQVAAPGFLRGYTHEAGWAKEELVPRMPVAEQIKTRYGVVWDRAWALFDASTGALVGSGEFPSGVPALSAEGGLCPLADTLWIAVQDGGRGGGILLDLKGHIAPERVLRPSGCPVGVGQRADQARSEGLHLRSPQQNARQSASPWPDSCRYYSASGSRGYHQVQYCSDMMNDGDPRRDVLVHIADLAFSEGASWRVVRFSHGLDGTLPVVFSGTPLALELGVGGAFIDLGAYDSRETVLHSPPESFAPDRRVRLTRRREVLAAVDRAGSLRWARTLEREDVEGGALGLDPLLPHRSALFASHPGSPVHNLYVLKPGRFIALDQATGEPRFEIAASP